MKGNSAPLNTNVINYSLRYMASGLEIAGCQWPKASHSLEMAREKKPGLLN